tara:strand:- start:803 stop:2281 length:1479 start_codon:yes stop_codon:yes gene_type:complete
MKILIWLQSGKIPFFSELSKILKEKGHDIQFVVRDKIIKKNLNFFLNNNSKEIEEKNIFIEEDKNINSNKILKLSKQYEKKYNFNISYYISQDRGLGRGYLINADNYPFIKRSGWNYYKKIRYFMRDFVYYEKILNKTKPKIVLSIAPLPLLYLICRKKKINYFSLSYSKLGERFLWSDNEFGTLNILKTIIRKNLKSKINKKTPSNIFKIIKKNTATFAHSVNKYSYKANFENFIKFTLLFIIRKFRGLDKKNSYTYLSWILRYYRIPKAFNYIKNNSISNLRNIKQKYIYIPMHLEPEMALQNFSPEFTNTFEMITSISKNLPTQYFIVLKEHPEMYGIRSISYYQKLKQIPNVIFANPNFSSFDLIKNSLAVATITGTAGFEAVFLKKQVLSFGIHQIINDLPTVHFCTNYYDTKHNIKKLFQKSKKINYGLSQSTLYHSIHKYSFELKDIDKLDDAFFNVKKSLKTRLTDITIWNKLATISVKNLKLK